MPLSPLQSVDLFIKLEDLLAPCSTNVGQYQGIKCVCVVGIITRAAPAVAESNPPEADRNSSPARLLSNAAILHGAGPGTSLVERPDRQNVLAQRDNSAQFKLTPIQRPQLGPLV